MPQVRDGAGDWRPQTSTVHREQQRLAALALLRRLPPQDLEQNLSDFETIAPHLEESLVAYVSRPLRLERDPEDTRFFIACEFNRVGDSYRSPWTNKYFPVPAAEEKDSLPRPKRLRDIEVTFNEVFDAYKTSYYEGGVSSVYLWDLDDGFAGAFLIRKEVKEMHTVKGVWDSVHLVEVREQASAGGWVEYKLSSSVCMHLASCEAKETELGAYVTRQVERKHKKIGEDSHLIHIGGMIEDVELDIRQHLDLVCMAKQIEMLNAVCPQQTRRCPLPVSSPSEHKES